MPASWPGPFGPAVIEAMACGTPVIAFNRGAVPGAVEDGRTVSIADGKGGAAAAVACLDSVPRAAVRAAFEARTAWLMAEGHPAIDRNPAARQAGPCAPLADATE